MLSLEIDQLLASISSSEHGIENLPNDSLESMLKGLKVSIVINLNIFKIKLNEIKLNKIKKSISIELFNAEHFTLPELYVQ